MVDIGQIIRETFIQTDLKKKLSKINYSTKFI